MAGNKKKTPHRKRSIPNSDIPLAERLRMNKLATIAHHRDDAALTALKLATVALNDSEGLGYTRLCRFAKRHQELTREYYSDPEYMEDQLNRRLEQIGFVVKDGRLFGAVNGEGEAIPRRMLDPHELSGLLEED